MREVYSDEAIKSKVYQGFFLERYREVHIEEVSIFLKTAGSGGDFSATALNVLGALELAKACNQSSPTKSTVILNQPL